MTILLSILAVYALIFIPVLIQLIRTDMGKNVNVSAINRDRPKDW